MRLLRMALVFLLAFTLNACAAASEYVILAASPDAIERAAPRLRISVINLVSAVRTRTSSLA